MFWKKEKTEEKQEKKNPVVKALEEELEASKQKVAATKMLLKQAKKGPQKPKKAFIETAPMRAYLTVARFVTGPFCKLHQEANMALEDPQAYIQDGLLKEAAALLEECDEHTEPSRAKAKSLAAQLFTLIAEFEQEEKKGAWSKGKKVLKDLKSEFKRLAPSTSEEGKKTLSNIEETMERTMEKVRAATKTPEPQEG